MEMCLVTVLFICNMSVPCCSGHQVSNSFPMLFVRSPFSLHWKNIRRPFQNILSSRHSILFCYVIAEL